MAMGILDSRYLAQQALLESAAAAIGNALIENGQRVWQVPDLDSAPWTIPGWATAFSRAALGDLYSRVMTSQLGTVGDARVTKAASDYLASQERAYRLRQLSPVRACMHAAGRRLGHGNPVGIFAAVTGQLQDLIVVGASAEEPPPPPSPIPTIIG